jgi:hypothetical protein
MTFNLAQTFYLEADLVTQCAEAGIVAVDLYFRAKPLATGNRSGIENPGVTVSLVPCINGVPNIAELDTIRPAEPTEHGARFAPRFETARKEYGEIIATTDASVATRFTFNNPMFVPTDYEYAILIKYDGNEDFLLWYSKAGDKLLGTNNISPGPSGKYIGNLYQFINSPNGNLNPANTGIGYSNNALDGSTSNNSAVSSTQSGGQPPVLTPNVDYLASNWKPVFDTDLKFGVFVARYSHNGFPVMANSSVLDDPYASEFIPTIENTPVVVTNNLIRIFAPAYNIEYITFDVVDSTLVDVYSTDIVFQEGIHWPGGTPTPLTISVANGQANVTANGAYLLANGSTFSAANGWGSIFDFDGTGQEFIIIDNGNEWCIRQVSQLHNANVISIIGGCSFTNTAAKFYKAPLGKMHNLGKMYRNVANTTKEYLQLVQSSANDSLRFVNNTILWANVTANGTGYSNSDYIIFEGFEEVANEVIGGYPATANIRTNASGNVTAIYLSNAGCGYVNTAWLTGANVQINNSSGDPSTGSGLTLSYKIGAKMRTMQNYNVVFGNCTIENLVSHRIKPEITVNNPLGTTFTIKHRNLYLVSNSTATYSGKKYEIDATPDEIPVKIFKSCDLNIDTDRVHVCPSRSNQFVIGYANGFVPNTDFLGRQLSNGSVYIFEVSSNNDFCMPFFEPNIIHSHYSKYIINDDYTNENTNYGNAVAKHVCTKVNFQKEAAGEHAGAPARFAEDLLVWLSAWRPQGTNIKILARIHNSNDPEAFDDKDWTLLEEIDGIGVFSSKTDQSDLIELAYNFTAAPNTAYTCNGSVTVNSTSNLQIEGSGTAFLTELAANDLIKIWSPLFPNNYYVGVVNTVVDNDSFTIRKGVGNNGLVGPGFRVDKLSHKKQGFNNILNDNVVRYYNEDMVEFDTYDTIQIKVVLLSNNDVIVPKIDDIRVAAVSA